MHRLYDQEYFRHELRHKGLDEKGVPRINQIMLSFNSNLKLPEVQVNHWLRRGWTVKKDFKTADEVHLILEKYLTVDEREELFIDIQTAEREDEAREINDWDDYIAHRKEEE